METIGAKRLSLIGIDHALYELGFQPVRFPGDRIRVLDGDRVVFDDHRSQLRGWLDRRGAVMINVC